MNFFCLHDRRNQKSITACGVLNKNCQPENIGTSSIERRHSLTKYQIDSSEYVQPKIDESLMNSYTDYEKARHNIYKLNIFSTVSSYIPSENSIGQSVGKHEHGIDESISIKTAQTKNDWIQEWAKNARRCNNKLANMEISSNSDHHSKTNYRCSQQNNNYNRVPQSYSTCFYQIEQFGDDTIEKSGDECMIKNESPNKNWGGIGDLTKNDSRRPPISPTKIPSPMHTHLRTRSSSANRSFRQSNIVS